MLNQQASTIERIICYFRKGSLFARVANRLGQDVQRFGSRQLLKTSLRQTGLSNPEAVPTYTKRVELETLYRLASVCPPGAKALEIGSHFGASSCYLAAGLAPLNGHLYCVDTWNNDAMPEGKLDTFQQFKANTSPLAQVVTPIRKKSTELSDGDLETPLDLAFIDGDHSYEAVRHDFLISARWLGPKGTVAMHDIIEFEGVARVVGEALASGKWTTAGQTKNLIWLKRPKWQL